MNNKTICVSECVLISPARHTFATINTQLELFLSLLITNNLFSNIISNFANRFLQYSHTVVRERPVILTAIFLHQTSSNTCKTSRSCINDITTERISRYNYDSHYRLAQTKTQAKKSEMSVSISDQFRKIYFIFKIILLHPKKKNTIFGNVTLSCTLISKSSIKKNNANTNNVWKRKLCQDYWNYSINNICYILCAISLSFMPAFFIKIKLSLFTPIIFIFLIISLVMILCIRESKTWQSKFYRTFYKGCTINEYIGIDAAETKRCRIAKEDYITKHYPLVEWTMDRLECEKYIFERKFPYVIKSGCHFCPFNSFLRWDYIKKKYPKLYKLCQKLERNSKHYE